MATCEVVNGTLLITGNLDKAGDPEFQAALEKYCAAQEGERVLDLSTVRWLNNTIAKLIVQAGQEILEKGSRLRVLASRHVQQTLSLLGAQSYLTIEATAAAPKPAVTLEPAGDASKTPAALLGLDDSDLMLPGLGAPAAGGPPVSSAGMPVVGAPPVDEAAKA